MNYKYRSLITLILFSFLLIIVIISCEKDNEEIFGVNNKVKIAELGISDLSYKTAKIKSLILESYDLEITEYGHCWSIEPSPDTSDFRSEFAEFKTDAFTTEMNDLNNNTKYYVRAYFKFGNIVKYSEEDVVFTTLKIHIPTVTTLQISNITAKSVESGGVVINANGGEITARGICWDVSTNPVITGNITSDSSGLGEFHSNLQNLDINATYYVRAYATNEGGTGYGREYTFTTKDGIPVVTTNEISNLKAISAQSGGIITENGGLEVITNGVCWNTTGNPNLTDSLIASEYNSKVYESDLSNLEINTNYYVSAFVTNELGTYYGNEISFITQDGILDIITKEISNITTTSANSGGIINDNEGLPLIETGVCWNTSGNPTIDDQKTSDAIWSDNFDSDINGLSNTTVYYARAYVINEVGINYGNQIEFTSNDGRPIINTVDVSEVTINSFKTGGEIKTDEGYVISEKGLCWNTTGDPSISDFVINEGDGIEDFTSIMSNINEGETYYIKAYAINAIGTGYGNELSVIIDYGEDVQVQDYDGNWYNTVAIGDQIWLGENLKTTHYPDGTSIKDGTGVNVLNLTSPEYHFAYSNNESNVETYGRLYTWYAATQACPDGWHMPAQSEWTVLFDNIGGQSNGGDLKTTGTIQEGTGLWKLPNRSATDEYNLSIVPAGYRSSINTFLYKGSTAWFIFSDNYEKGYTFQYDSGYILELTIGGGGNDGLPVRCIKD